MVNKKSKFVKDIEILERDGYKVDGAVVLFTSKTGDSSLVVEGHCGSRGTLILRANEHIELELELAKARRKAYVESETKSILGTGKSEVPGYTE